MANDPIEWDALSLAVKAELAAKGPDLSAEACHCGRFGAWGIGGGVFYCEMHVPPEVRYRGQFLAETME